MNKEQKEKPLRKKYGDLVIDFLIIYCDRVAFGFSEAISDGLEFIPYKRRANFILILMHQIYVAVPLPEAFSFSPSTRVKLFSKVVDLVLKYYWKDNGLFPSQIEKTLSDYLEHDIVDEISDFLGNIPKDTPLPAVERWVQLFCPEGLQMVKEGGLTNHINKEYVLSDPNSIWCIDVTERGGLWVIVIIDLASRYVFCGYCSEKAPCTGEVMLAVNYAMNVAKAKPQILHSDQGSCFMSEKFQQYLAEENIKLSTDLRHGHSPDNQVVESFNRILWSFLDLNRNNPEAILRFSQKTAWARTNLVEAAIEYYSGQKKVTGKKYTPRELYEALLQIDLKLEIQVSSKDPIAKDVEIVHDFAVDLVKVHKELAYLDAEKNEDLQLAFKLVDNAINHGFSDLEQAKMLFYTLRPMLEAIKSSLNIIKNNFETLLLNQNRLLEEQQIAKEDLSNQILFKNAEVEVLTSRLSTLVTTLEKERAMREQEDANKEARRQARLNAQKLPLRNQVEDDDIRAILDSVKSKDPFIVARDRIAILLIFVYGLRISNISLIKVQDLRRLSENKPIEIKLLKDRNGQSFRLVPFDKLFEWFKFYKQDLDFFLRDPRHGAESSIYPTSRETLTRRINKYFKAIGEKKGKFLRSHSARVTVATKAIEKVGITKAQHLLGHKNIMSTVRYDRNNMTPSEQKDLYNALSPEAPVIVKKRGRPKKETASTNLTPITKTKKERVSKKKKSAESLPSS